MTNLSELSLCQYRAHRARIMGGAPDVTCSIADVTRGAIVRHSGLHRQMQESLAKLRACPRAL
jgi:hypothetical protein